MSAIAIVNRNAGKSLDLDEDSLRTALETAFREAGLEADLHLVGAEDIGEALEQAASGPSDLIVAGGGDGTLNAAASLAVKHDKTLGILPMGTMNVLARNLDVPLDLSQAARVIATGTVRKIDAAEVNGHYYFCNSYFGLPALFSEERENQRGEGFFNRLFGYLFEFPKLALAARRMAVAVHDGERERLVRSLAYAVSNNPYDQSEEMALHRGSLTKGKLGFYATKHYSALALPLFIAKFAIGRGSTDPSLVHMEADALEVRSSRKTIAVTNDGELMKLATPLRYRIHPAALRVVLPADS
jgi:diacylglycerol kinase family enzyme